MSHLYINIWVVLFTPKLSWRREKEKLAAKVRKSIFAIKSYQRNFGYFSYTEYFDSVVKHMVPRYMEYNSQTFLKIYKLRIVNIFLVYINM